MRSIPNERRPRREGRGTGRSGVLRPGRGPADVGRSAGGRSERLPGPAPYQRGRTFRGYRNGYHPARELTVGLGPVAVRVPRVAQVPREVAPQGYHSGVVQRYQRASQTTQRLFARLYLEGLATGDFEPVFRELVGETTALSANTVVRLKEHWGGEYEAWRQRPLGEHRSLHLGRWCLCRRGPSKRRRRSCVSFGKMGRRNCWRWRRATGRAPRVGPT